MEERERARARRRRRRRQQKSSVKWPRFIVAVIVVLALLGGIGYGLYTGVSYVYRAVTGTTETTDTAVDNGNKQDGNTVSVEQKGLDKPLYILVVGTDDNNPSQSDSLFLLSINLDQKQWMLLAFLVIVKLIIEIRLMQVCSIASMKKVVLI